MQVRYTEKHFMAERDMFYHPGEQFTKSGTDGGDDEMKSKEKKGDW